MSSMPTAKGFSSSSASSLLEGTNLWTARINNAMNHVLEMAAGVAELGSRRCILPEGSSCSADVSVTLRMVLGLHIQCIHYLVLPPYQAFFRK